MMNLLANPTLYVLAIVFGIFIASIVILLLNNYGYEKDKFQGRLNQISGSKTGVDYLDDNMNKPFSERVLRPFGDKIYGGIRRISQQSNGEDAVNDQRNLKLRSTLRQSGSKMTVNEYRTMRILVILGSGVVAGILAFLFSKSLLITALCFGIAMLLAFTVLRFTLATNVTNRKQKMQSQLPEVLDMISVSVEAGLGLEQAMVEVVKHFDGPLIEEIAITNREMAMGRSRNDALELLGTRCESEEILTFTRAIIQATEMGIAVKNVLRSQSEYMRQTHKNKVEEKAMKVSIKILFPMLLFIFPVVIIILLGPAVLNVLDTL
jgi:tight adherence protein C